MKLKMILTSVLALFLLTMVGCGTTSTPSQSKDSNKTSGAQSTSNNTKQADMIALTGFELSMIEDMHGAIAPVNSLISLGSASSFDAAGTKKAADAAAKSAQDYATKVKNYALPDKMSSATKAQLKSALNDLATSFQQDADAAKACANVTSQAELTKAVAKIDPTGQTAFQSFQSKMNTLHKNFGLVNSDFAKEMQ